MLTCALLLGASFTVQAQNEWYKNIKFSGYAITEYKYTSQENKEPDNEFGVKMVRLLLDGKVATDFNYRVQMQVNGMSGSTTGARIVDAYVEWQKLSYARVKIGQFKRPFTFENPLHPIDQGFSSFAQSVTKLSGLNDRVGEHACSGRDIGIQLQGDVLPLSSGRPLLHYQIGVFNGQGINTADVDNKKDIIGGFWFMPISGVRIGASGWTGTYAKKISGVINTVDRNRYALSAEYCKDDWQLRSEYLHSEGRGFVTDNATGNIDKTAADRSDGWYVSVVAPVKTDVCHVKARYDAYRDDAQWASTKNMYELGVDYIFFNRVKAQVSYAYVNDRMAEKHNYNQIDCQVSVKF